MQNSGLTVGDTVQVMVMAHLTSKHTHLLLLAASGPNMSELCLDLLPSGRDAHRMGGQQRKRETEPAGLLEQGRHLLSSAICVCVCACMRECRSPAALRQ